MKTLLPHQLEDAQFLASRKFAGNFSGMGSGKTLTALEAFRIVADDARPLIIVGPPISLSMWRDEIIDWLDIKPEHILMVEKGSTPLTSAVVYILSYDIATKRRDELKALNADVLICDESHALKTPSTKRTKAIIGAHGICESVNHTWLLTGTPSTKYNDDMFTFLARADNAGAARPHLCRGKSSRRSPRACGCLGADAAHND
jgi:SWI/SNF-related matrix-associated actin-dependent regulator 1 of chromatin subfamily A